MDYGLIEQRIAHRFRENVNFLDVGPILGKIRVFKFLTVLTRLCILWGLTKVSFAPLPRSDPMTDDLKSRVEFAGGTTVIRVK